MRKKLHGVLKNCRTTLPVPAYSSVFVEFFGKEIDGGYTFTTSVQGGGDVITSVYSCVFVECFRKVATGN